VWLGQLGANRPLLIIVHGGFWRPQYGRDQISTMAAALAEAGWSVTSIGFRRIPGDPDASVEDVRRSVEVLPEQVRPHNGRVVMIGHSAGGHLALLASMHRSSALSAVLALAPAADLRQAEILGLGNGAVGAFLGTSATARPDLDPSRLTPTLIPTHLIHGDADEVVPLSISASFLSKHRRASMMRLPDIGHFALIDPKSTAWVHVVDQLAAWSGSEVPL
jgi:acetyl esterase/lipase